MEDEEIYDVAPADEKPVNFKALKDTWNMMGPGPQSPPPAHLKAPWMKPAVSTEVNSTPKPNLPLKKGPQMPVSLNDVLGRRQNLNCVPDKRESARTSKVAIPDAFQQGPSKSKPVVSPKPAVMRKPVPNDATGDATAPKVPAKGAGTAKEPSRRRTLMPPDSNDTSPTAASKAPPLLPTKRSPSESQGNKTGSSEESSRKSNSVKRTSQPTRAPGQTVTSADGKTYILRPMPVPKGVGPIKPQRPPSVILPISSTVGDLEGEELYDEVEVLLEAKSGNKSSPAARPVSTISEYTEEQEETFERQKSRKLSAAPRESTLGEDLYDTVENCLPDGEQDEIYDDDMVMNPVRDSTVSESSLYEAFDQIVEEHSKDLEPQASQKSTVSSRSPGNSMKMNGEVKPTDEEELELYDDVAHTAM